LLLLDRYRVVRLIGTGGFSTVYEATDTRIGRQCAIKMIPAPSSAQREQIRIEAEILGRYASKFPFIPDVYDIFDDTQQTYLVMEYIEGTTLDDCQPLPWSAAQAESALRTLLGDLAQMHAVGIVHRDLKPQNIIRKPNGQYVLVDFGIAKQGATTQRGAQALSPDYAPPEQITGHTDTRSDLYSLGATIYHLLTGQPPTPFPIRQAGGLLQPPSRLARGVRPELDAVLLQLLEPNPARRPASAQAALDRLPVAQTLPVPPPGPQPTPQPRRWWPLAIGAVLLLCVLGAGGVFVVGTMISNRPTPTPGGVGAALTPLPATRTPRPTVARTPTGTRPSPTAARPTVEPSPLPAPSQQDTVAPTAVPPAQTVLTDLGHTARFLYGPESGQLEQQQDYISSTNAGVSLSDSITQVAFANPPVSGTSGWDYGFLFRHTGANSSYQVFVTSERRWFFYTASDDTPIKQGKLTNLNVLANGSNTLRLIVNQSSAFFFVNGVYVDTLDVSQKVDSGDIKVGTGFLQSDTVVGNATAYHDLMIWALDPNPSPPTAWRGQLVASDDFADNHNKWYLGDTADGKANRAIRDGMLVMTFREPNLIWAETWTVGSEQNFVSEIDVTPLSPSGEGGLVFGHQDEDNYYTARISAVGDYVLEEQQGGQWADPSPLPWKKHTAILSGAAKSNRVLVTRQGDQVRIYVNSVLVGTTQAGAFTSGQVGVAAASGDEPNEEIDLRNFRLWRLP